MGRLRLFTAGLVAFLLGVPLTEKALAATTTSVDDIIGAVLTLIFGIVDACSGG